MAWSLYLAGFNVKDVHMTDLICGRETLEDVRMVVFVGGFSNADTPVNSSISFHVILLSIKEAGAIKHMSLKTVTVSP